MGLNRLSAETIGQVHDKVVAARFFRRLLDLFAGGVHSANSDVVVDRMEKIIRMIGTL